MLIPFFLPFLINTASSTFNYCNWEEFLELSLTFIELLQSISLCLIFLTKSLKTFSIPEIPWFSTKFSPHESNASLAPSRISSPSSRDEPIYSWQEVVSCAKNSGCYENEIASISSISTSPEPHKNCNEVIYEVPRSSDGSRRHTIRHVMMRAKNNNLSNVEEIMPKKVISPPLPKNIPSEILDDVRLFDFYYKNLDSIFIADGENCSSARNSNLSDEVEKRSSSNRISRMLSFGQQQQVNKKKLISIQEDSMNVNKN